MSRFMSVLSLALLGSLGACLTREVSTEQPTTKLSFDTRLPQPGIDKLDLVEGTYRLDLAAHKADGYPYDYHRLLYTFRVKSKIRDVGIYRPDHKWSFEGGIKISS